MFLMTVRPFEHIWDHLWDPKTFVSDESSTLRAPLGSPLESKNNGSDDRCTLRAHLEPTLVSDDSQRFRAHRGPDLGPENSCFSRQRHTSCTLGAIFVAPTLLVLTTMTIFECIWEHLWEPQIGVAHDSYTLRVHLGALSVKTHFEPIWEHCWGPREVVFESSNTWRTHLEPVLGSENNFF